MTALRQQMTDDMVVRGLSAGTQEAHLRAVTRLAIYYGRSPDRISEREIQTFLLHLYREKHFSYSACNVVVSGLRFFYHVTLRRPSTSFVIPAARQPSKLPEILTREELTRLFSGTSDPKHRTLLLTAYAAGLRVSEVVALQTRDIEAERGALRVRQGKGARDRTTLLSPRLLDALRDYWRHERPDSWLFPSRHHARPRVIYDLLFRAASETLQTFARDPKHLGGELGLTAILHTWSQTLSLHPHLHCIVTGGALASDGSRWIPTRHPSFLFPVRALAKVFRGRFIDGLRQRFARGELGPDDALPALFHTVRQHDWVVYAKPPFAGPESVLRYLGRYTHRIALSNRRILRVEQDQVALRYRDYADRNRIKVLQLSVHELLRRFLLHVLPDGFVRIRHYGLFANRSRKPRIARCRELLAAEAPPAPPAHETVGEK